MFYEGSECLCWWELVSDCRNMIQMLFDVSYTGMINLKNSYFSHAELKQALKKFKAQHDDVQRPLVSVSLDFCISCFNCCLTL